MLTNISCLKMPVVYPITITRMVALDLLGLMGITRLHSGEQNLWLLSSLHLQSRFPQSQHALKQTCFLMANIWTVDQFFLALTSTIHLGHHQKTTFQGNMVTLGQESWVRWIEEESWRTIRLLLMSVLQNHWHGDQYQLPPNACILDQISKRIPERSNSISSVVAGKVISRPEDQYQLPQFYKLPNHFQFDELSKHLYRDLSSGKQCENYTCQQNSFNKNQIPVQKQREIQQQEWCVLQHIGATNFVDSSNMPLKDVLLLYSYYKTVPENKGKNQSALLHLLHKRLCVEKQCYCNWFQICISHYENCCYNFCTLCKPVRESLSCVKSEFENSKSGLLNAIHNRDLNGSSTSMVDDAPPPTKRVRIGDYVHSNPIASSEDQSFRSEGTSAYESRHEGSHIQANEKEEFMSPEGTLRTSDTTNQIPDNMERVRCDDSFVSEALDDGTGIVHQLSSDITAALEQQNVIQEPSDIQCTSKPQDQPNVVIKCLSKPQEQLNVIQEPGDIQCVSKACQIESKVEIDSSEAATSHHLRTSFGDLGKFPVSYVDFFNSEQIKEHISSLSLSLGQSIGTELKENPKENFCRLCSMEKHFFGPAPLYCSRCCNLIKHNSIYYWAPDEMGSRHYFCPICFKVSHGSSISVQGHSFSKAQMWKDRNNIEIEESWVQCDKCEHWIHQICGLYNAKRDAEGKAKYTCPYCRLEEIKLGKHVPLTATFGARDLPRTMLSDHIEERLFTQLKREREERAKFSNKDINEVPGAGELVVRVVSSVSKIMKVNQDFLNIIPDQDYPEEFPYKLKVILLFQKIEGIDVCLFCMYVQEYGSECDKPNQRSVYISYLDSIKYFRPEIQTVTGEALRTFIYHEILIGYLDYCKSRGFAACYIWACPPYRKEDYIFNCHPDSQKIPKPDKLRQWYKSMLKKAMKDGVVVNYKTFYETFFIQNEECNNKITVAHLPYFDGDYWSDAAEDITRKMQEENGGESEGKVKKPLTKRTMKAMGHKDLKIDATKDILVMQKLGQTMLPTKENFLVVQLLSTCKNCQNLILSGGHWFCNQCKFFCFCSRCLEMDPNLKERNMHTSIGGEEHLLSKVVINDLPADTAEEDVSLNNNIFENRHSFLSFCQENNYQFNTLRRAKHSSMMILYDLSKQMWLVRKTACSICHKDIMVGAQWHCEIRPKFDVCDTCRSKVGVDYHKRNIILNFPTTDCGTNKYEALPEKADQVQYRIALEHASQCSSSQSNPCLRPDCLKVKRLFHHSPQCNIRPAGGCITCWRIWILIRLHSVRCKDANCKVPRCRDVRAHIKECSGWCRYCFNWRCFVANARRK